MIAKLFGLPFAPFEQCRMLEIGCGDGVNLINLALFHDELGEFYEPEFIDDVAAAGATNGLLYLADARPRTLEEALFPSESASLARERAGGDWARYQQYLDFQDMRSFHNAIFVKGGAPDRRRCASRLKGLWIQCELREVERDAAKPDEAVFVTGEGVRMSTDDPNLTMLFRDLAQAYPLMDAAGVC